MPRKVQRLRQEALEGCNFRNHSMGRFSYYHENNIGISLCTNPGCSGYVQILTKPMPNEIEIGGDAVALQCPIVKDVTERK